MTRFPAPPATDLAARGNELLASQIPRIAQRAAGLVQRVLDLADQPNIGVRDEEIRTAASAIRLAPDELFIETGITANEAWNLNEAAAAAFWQRRNVQEALTLQTRAFGANPLDAEIAANLAFYYLRQNPPQPDAARQLALHALTVPRSRYAVGRVEDWTTLAIASALSGRNRDARNAWFVTLALAPNLERQCRAAINAYALYGERLRAPVEAMLYRLHASGRPHRTAFCEWPPHWRTTTQWR